MSLTVSPVSLDLSTRLRRSRGRSGRVFSINSKLTEPELRLLENVAAENGKAVSEWAREVLLRSDVIGNHTEMEMHIFTELVGIQMLLMGTLEPLLRGEKMVHDQITILFRQVQSTKAAKAQELLEKRAKQRAEDASRAGR